MASPCTLFVLLVLLCFYAVQADRDGGSYRVVQVETLIPAADCSLAKAYSGGGFMVTHRHGPCSQSGVGKLNHLERFARDSRRVASLQELIRGKSPSSHVAEKSLDEREVTLPALNGEIVGSADYVVTVGFGTPMKKQTLIFDTGSGVCWIQCQPCLGSCYDQVQPIFNPFGSSSYRNVSCSSKTCRALPSRACSSGTCLYFVRYGDNSATAGFLGTERLTLAPGVVFPNFAFGCGERNEGLFSGVAGLLGLARSSFSLISQTSRSLGNVFSYCLPGPRNPAGHLTINGINKKVLAAAAYTPMLGHSEDPSLYFLNLIGISVGGHPIQVTPTAFKSGTIIDSGTVITRLPPAVYNALRRAFRRSMSQYTLTKPVDLLDTCYDLKNLKNVSCPTVTLHYDGANVPLEPLAVLIETEGSQFCLAFAANDNPDDIAIIGNVQQREMEVIYDVGAKQIGFAHGDCA